MVTLVNIPGGYWKTSVSLTRSSVNESVLTHALNLSTRNPCKTIVWSTCGCSKATIAHSPVIDGRRYWIILEQSEGHYLYGRTDDTYYHFASAMRSTRG